VELGNWHPGIGGLPEEAVWSARLGERDFLDTVARGHGYAGWRAVEAEGPARPDPRFEACVEAILSGDIESVAAALRAHPELATARSRFGHRATLLHYLAANGVEIHRQRVPTNAADLARLLLDHGADPGSEAHMYGAPRTTLGMLLSSSHPADAGLTEEIAGVLRRGRRNAGLT